MSTHTCCHKQEVKKGPWSPDEDLKLIECISTHGQGNWASIPSLAGLQRCGKSCRVRWRNHLRPGLKRGGLTSQEKSFIVDIQKRVGNRWAYIAKNLPGRTEDEVKNFWSTYIKNKNKHQDQNSLLEKDSIISSNSCQSVINAPSSQVNTINLPMTLQGLNHVVPPHMTLDIENLGPTSLDVPVVSCAPDQFLNDDNHLYSNSRVEAYMQELAMILDPSMPNPTNITEEPNENAFGVPISSDNQAQLLQSISKHLGLSSEIDACERDVGFVDQALYPSYMSNITSMMGPFSSTTTLSATSTSTYSILGSTLAPRAHDASLF